MFERFPGYRAGVVVADGVVNGPTDPAAEAALAAAESALSVAPPASRGDPRGLAPALEHPHLAAWRDAFRAFGAKRYRCSAEALISRAVSGEGLPRISALVDRYNAVSVAHCVPVGGEDLDNVVPPVRLVVAGGGEPFDDAVVKAGEVVWADAVGVTCRRWNWRQGVRTRLTAATTRAYFLFDALPPLGDDELEAAMEDLRASLLTAWPGARVSSWVVPGPGTAAG